MNIFPLKNFNQLITKKNVIIGLVYLLFGIASAISATNHIVPQFWDRRLIVQVGLLSVTTLLGCAFIGFGIYRFVWLEFCYMRRKEQISITFLSLLLGAVAFQPIHIHISSPRVNNTLEIISSGQNLNENGDPNFKILEIRINEIKVPYNNIEYDHAWVEQNGELVSMDAGGMKYEFLGHAGDKIEILFVGYPQSSSMLVRLNGDEEYINLSTGQDRSYQTVKTFVITLNPLIHGHFTWFVLLYGADFLTLTLIIWVLLTVISHVLLTSLNPFILSKKIKDGVINGFIPRSKFQLVHLLQLLYLLKYQIAGVLLQILGYIFITHYFFERNFLDFVGFEKYDILNTVLGLLLIVGGVLVCKKKEGDNTKTRTIKSNIVFVWMPTLILIFYAWTTYSSNIPNRENYFGYLSQAFSAGQTNFLFGPDPRLLTLPDPYDPAQNAIYRVHCASLYNGKYYLYNGPINAILFYLPYFWITNNNMPNDLACFMFGGGGFLFGLLSIYLIREKYFSRISHLGMTLCILTLGISNIVLFEIRRPLYIEIAVLGGLFWANVALFLYILYLSVKPARLSIICLSAIAYAFAFCARIDYIIGSVIFIIPVWLIYNENKNTLSRKVIIRKIIQYVFTVGIPFIIVGTLYLWYNYIRFDKIFEFGQAYVLDSVKPSLWIRSLEQVPFNVYIYLFDSPIIDTYFPFFHLRGAENIPYFIPHPNNRFIDSTPNIGWFPDAPILGLIILFVPILLFLYRHAVIDRIKLLFSGQKIATKSLSLYNLSLKRLPFIVIAILLIILGNMFILFPMNTHTLRYQLDLLPYILLVVCIGYMYFETHLQKFRPILFNSFRILATITVIYSVVLNVSISFTGEEPLLAVMWPKLYSRMRDTFDFIPALNSIYTKKDDVRLIIKQPFYWEKLYEYEISADNQFLLSNDGVEVKIFAFEQGWIKLSPNYLIKIPPSKSDEIIANINGLNGNSYKKSFDVWPTTESILIPVSQGVNTFQISFTVNSAKIGNTNTNYLNPPSDNYIMNGMTINRLP